MLLHSQSYGFAKSMLHFVKISAVFSLKQRRFLSGKKKTQNDRKSTQIHKIDQYLISCCILVEL